MHRAAPAVTAQGGNLSGGSAEDFNNDANFGDVGKGFYQGDQTLDDDQIQSTMMANYRKLIPCIVHAPVSNIALEFAVRGNGKVSAVKVNGQRTGALPGCMLAACRASASRSSTASRPSPAGPCRWVDDSARGRRGMVADGDRAPGAAVAARAEPVAIRPKPAARSAWAPRRADSLNPRTSS